MQTARYSESQIRPTAGKKRYQSKQEKAQVRVQMTQRNIRE